LLFLAFNADIERQFEFIQHTWLGNPVFAGLSGELDPITVEQPVGGGRFSIPQRPVRDRLAGLPSFTTTRGGAYFFLPGIEGLRLLLGDGVLRGS
jgi:deferrochelatase/peroxidase EfeB